MADKPRRADTGPYWDSAVIATSRRKADDSGRFTSGVDTRTRKRLR